METFEHSAEGPRDFQEALERGDIVHITNLPLREAGYIMGPQMRRYISLEYRQLEKYGDRVIISDPLPPNGIETDIAMQGIFIREQENGLRGFYVTVEDYMRVQVEQAVS